MILPTPLPEGGMMKRTIIFFMVISLIAGCGKKEQARQPKKFQGVVAKKRDYAAEGIQYLKQKDIPNAIRSFDLAIKQDPSNVSHYMLLGEVYLRLKNYTQAIDTFTAATKVDPVDGDAYYFLAYSMLMRRGPHDFQNAVEALKKSIVIFTKTKDEAKLKRSVELLRTLVGNK